MFMSGDRKGAKKSRKSSTHPLRASKPGAANEQAEGRLALYSGFYAPGCRLPCQPAQSRLRSGPLPAPPAYGRNERSMITGPAHADPSWKVHEDSSVER